jgi:hypothetical protein
VSPSSSERLPALLVQQTSERLRDIAQRLYPDICRELILRVRGRSLYIDVHRVGEEDGPPTKMCRIDWLGRGNEWAFSFYRYSQTRYERNVTVTGKWTGTAEECFAAASFAYLETYRMMNNPSKTNGGAD